MTKHQPRPTPEQLAWEEYEIGLFFHWDIEVFQNSWKRGDRPLPDASVWTPDRLDTDQWLETAVAAGAKYALLTAKHGTGFCLWPTRQHGYHVGNTPGGRDVVGEFVASCRKYGVAPGLYYSLRAEYIDDMFTDEAGRVDRPAMNRLLLAQVEELVTDYGPLAELWFDGGIPRPELGGPDIPGLVNRIAPGTICHGANQDMVNQNRWSGSEQGVAPKENWSTSHYRDEDPKAAVICAPEGSPDDTVWAPTEVDIPNRDVLGSFVEGWMYHPGEADRTYSGEYLFARYLTSVGRNANLLIGALPDERGLLSADQTEAFADFGRRVKAAFGAPLAATAEMTDGGMELHFERPVDLCYAVMAEDQAGGQHVLEWELQMQLPKSWLAKGDTRQWVPVDEGRSIGHKRIVQLNLLRVQGIRLHLKKAKPGLRMRSFEVYGRKVYD